MSKLIFETVFILVLLSVGYMAGYYYGVKDTYTFSEIVK